MLQNTDETPSRFFSHVRSLRLVLFCFFFDFVLLELFDASELEFELYNCITVPRFHSNEFSVAVIIFVCCLLNFGLFRLE